MHAQRGDKRIAQVSCVAISDPAPYGSHRFGTDRKSDRDRDDEA